MKKTIILFMLVVFSSLLGHYIGEFCLQYDAAAWLAKAYEIGLSNMEFDMKILYFKLDFKFNICIAQVITITASLFCYPMICNKLD